jgi:uncharacterized glyoxalase superfamily protein PhnB/DNA-binding XRE family transcriptional regulator
MNQQGIGKKIRLLRDKRGWTQDRLATVSGVALRTVQRAEEGAMSAETLTALASAFDIAVEELTHDESAYPAITPFLFYEDGATVDWLVRCFGFTIRMKVPGPAGTIVHGELEHRGGLLMVGTTSEREKRLSPRAAGGVQTHGLYLIVEDADAHCATARAAGAKILSEPVDAHGHRRYVAEDPEGYHWMFASVPG